MDVPADLVEFALELAQVARAETLRRWAGDCAAEDKGNGAYDPVTEADRQAERSMRDLIHSRYPDHGVTGEEWPDEPGCSAWHWSLDPVDGTRSFICGLPTWVTLVGLVHDLEPILGIIDAPCLDEQYIGFAHSAFIRRGGRDAPLRTTNCTRLADARLSTTDPFLFEAGSDRAFTQLRGSVRTTRYGYDGYAYARLAAGSIDLIVESGLKPHDYEAIVPLVDAAGGAVGDWRGGREFGRGKIIAAATRELYEVAVEIFEAFA